MLTLKSQRGWLPQVNHIRTYFNKRRIGNRDVVGHGCNGIYAYKDDTHFPFPAVRFKENSPYIASLRLKEKGDWNQLTCEEKKSLYRASFCQTFSEFTYFTGAWMFCLGWGLIFVGCGFWIMMYYHFYIQNEEIPKSLTPRSKSEQLRRMINLHINPIDGLASLWNYKDHTWLALQPE